ncbi:MAG: hypothetical protein ACR2RL_23820, partial [Gammaproteobacteria bacterium]
GLQVIKDYRGVDVYSAYAPLNWQGVSWAVIAEIDKAEVDAPTLAMRTKAIAIGLGCAVVAFLLGLLLADRRTAQATDGSNASARKLAENSPQT